MIFTPAFLVSYLTSGVGLSQKPPLFLGVGNTVSLGIEGLGEQRPRVLASREGVQGCKYISQINKFSTLARRHAPVLSSIWNWTTVAAA
jgi:hypothetical protein